MEEEQTDLSFDGRQVGFALGSADGAVVMDPLRRRKHVLEEHRDLPPALRVEPQAEAPDQGSGLIESASDRRIGSVGDDRTQRAGKRLAPERGRQPRPLLSVEPRVRSGAVVVLECAADLTCAHQLDAIELEEHADVVGNVGQGRVEQARDLGRTGLAVDAKSLEDALPQRVRQGLGEIRIERPIPSGILAGGRH